MTDENTKKRAEIVEYEWRRWLELPNQFPTDELLNAWSDLLEAILGREPDLSEGK